jgi:hypothetical protein
LAEDGVENHPKILRVHVSDVALICGDSPAPVLDGLDHRHRGLEAGAHWLGAGWQQSQFLPGYCVLLVDDPSIDRLTDLPSQILGNTDAYLHAHLFARYDWEPAPHVGRPVWLYKPEDFYGPDTAVAARHDDLRQRLVTELKSLGVAT